MAEAVDLAARRAARHTALSDARPAPYTVPERVAMANLIAERLFSASLDGATARPLLVEETRNLADAVVALIEECKAATR